MTFAIADLFERVAAAVPERQALVTGGADGSRERLSYAQLDEAAETAASVFEGVGIGPGDRVGVHLFNHRDHVATLLGLCKLRAVPVNLNVRYVADELAYVLADAGAVAVVTEPDLDTADQAARLAAGLPAGALPPWPTLPPRPEGATPVVLRRHDVRLGGRRSGGTRPARTGRSGDDLLLLYTGGTTGAPKGVMWRQEDLYFAALGGRGTPSQGVRATVDPDDVTARALGRDPIRRRFPLCPLFHGGALWIVLQSLLSGGTAIVSTDRHVDGAAACDLLAGEDAELLMVIGDAIARPIADALAGSPGRWDLSVLQVIASGGAVLSPATVAALRDVVPHVKVVDTFGASETGGQGRLVASPHGGPPRLLSDEESEVFTDDLRPTGVGEVGRLARRGRIPLGYWGDPVKTAATFPVVDGRRWSVPGDLARREADGAITLLGRGATSINTGGEKVFPEEVESVLRAHPAVADALVVGVADPRLGQRVAAVVALRPDVDDPGDEALGEHCRAHLAGYKVPRRWVRVAACRRLVTGKPDYAWARSVMAT